MKLLSLLDKLGAVAPAPDAASPAPTAPTSRRALLRAATQVGGRALVASLPLAATLPAAAAAATILDSLTLLLTLADLQQALYARALTSAGLVPATARPDLTRTQQLHQQQAAFLRGLYIQAGTPAPAVPTFDFSGSRNGAGPVLFPGVFASFDGFLQLAQPLADAAAGIYLGQLATVRTDALLLSSLLSRQAVEARLASHLRTLRRGATSLPKSWPSPLEPTAPTALAVIQTSENTTQQQVPNGVDANGSWTGVRYLNFTGLFSDTAVQTTSLAEAFDEPVTTEQAIAMLALFQ